MKIQKTHWSGYSEVILMWIESVEQQYYKACTGVICKKPYEFFFNSRTIYRKSILIGAIEEWIINKSIDSRAIQQYRYLSWYYVRLLNKFQSLILIRSPPFSIPGFFVLFIFFLFWTCILLELISYDGLWFRLTHLSVVVLYII